MVVDQIATNAIIQTFLVDLAAYMAGFFPHHAAALRGEIIGTKLTEDRWRRISAILGSLHAIPGVMLSPGEHDVRNDVLRAITVTRKMADAAFGGRDPDNCRELALWVAADIGDRMRQQR